MPLRNLPNDQSISESLSPCSYVLAMVAPICALPPLSDSLRESGSHLNVRCRTLMFVKGVGRATQGVQVSYCWLATQMGELDDADSNFP